MKYLAAYALLTLSGKKDITANDIKGVLGSVASNTSDEDINKVISLLKGKSVHELIAQGQGRLGASGPVTASASVSAPAAGNKKADKKQQPKKKEAPPPKVEEPVEEDADLGDLFG